MCPGGCRSTCLRTASPGPAAVGGTGQHKVDSISMILSRSDDDVDDIDDDDNHCDDDDYDDGK